MDVEDRPNTKERQQHHPDTGKGEPQGTAARQTLAPLSSEGQASKEAKLICSSIY